MNATLGLVITVLAVFTGIGTAAAFLTSGRNKGRLDDLRKDVDDRNKRITFLEQENERHEETETRQQEVIDHLRGEVDTLRKIVTGQSGPTKELSTLVEAHHEAALAGFAKLDGQMTDVLALLGDKRTPRSPT